MALLGDIVSTNMIALDNKVLNQRRALWLTPQKARNILVANNEKLEIERRAALEKIPAKERSILAKRNRASLIVQVATNLIEGKKNSTSTRIKCNNDCGSVRNITTLGETVPYDNWLGCTLCECWYCGKVNCRKKFSKHHVICLEMR